MTPEERIKRIDEMLLRVRMWEDLISSISTEESWTIEQEAAYKGAQAEREKCFQIIGEHIAELTRIGFSISAVRMKVEDVAKAVATYHVHDVRFSYMVEWRKSEAEAAQELGAKVGDYKAFHSVESALEYCRDVADVRRSVGEPSDFEIVQGWGDRKIVGQYKLYKNEDGAWEEISEDNP